MTEDVNKRFRRDENWAPLNELDIKRICAQLMELDIITDRSRFFKSGRTPDCYQLARSL